MGWKYLINWRDDARCVPDTLRHHADVSGHPVRDDRLLAGPVLGGRTADAVADVAYFPR